MKRLLTGLALIAGTTLPLTGCVIFVPYPVPTSVPGPTHSDPPFNFDEVAAETLEFAQKLIGLTEQAAIDAIREAGYSHRIAERDGEQFALTEDYSPQRINLLVADNKVFDVWVG
ncbi:hypothetical protein [Rhodoluna limnophila]|uniref:hypothetical protein n=1 Tax=Rhodoluna limnophila TaxID=232537 RepID=UPI0011059DED|nr:hypothetical protein [Rhodoluna limnophila]